jgi:ATP-dependent DNA helicase DinG
VDVQGPSCRLVAIDRIPFPRPDDPVARARAIDAERHGLSGFRAVSLSHAALLMAQGAGRLLRSREDRGMVAVLDPRLVTKGYGSFIRHSMPAMWPTTDPAVARASLERLADALDG